MCSYTYIASILHAFFAVNYTIVMYSTNLHVCTYILHIYGVATISMLLKIYVCCAAYSLFYRALLQKRLIILRSLLIVATPYHMYPIHFTISTHITHIAALRKIRRGHHRRAYSDEIDLFRADIQKALVRPPPSLL